MTRRPAFLALGLALVVWALGHVRLVPEGAQAVVLRFGAVARVAGPGLAAAAPWPFESIVIAPGGQETPLAIGPAGGIYLTGDGGEAALAGTIFWRIADAGAALQAPADVPALLRALFRRAATSVAARRGFADFAPDAAGPAAAIAAAMNAALDDVGASGLGLAVTRVALSVAPPADGFAPPADAASRASAIVAQARADAARAQREGAEGRAAALAGGQAEAAERIAHARAVTAGIVALAGSDAASRPGLLSRIYRARMAAILKQAGSVTVVDAKAVSRVIVPGP